jgi:hypothetical protein
MHQVGTEGGFLPAVAVHDNTTPIQLDLASDPAGTTAKTDGPFNLLLAPAERADIVVDFNGVPEGTSFILYNDAPAPFPGGDRINDYATGDQDRPPTHKRKSRHAAGLWSEYTDTFKNRRDLRFRGQRKYVNVVEQPEHETEDEFSHRKSARPFIQ